MLRRNFFKLISGVILAPTIGRGVRSQEYLSGIVTYDDLPVHESNYRVGDVTVPFIPMLMSKVCSDREGNVIVRHYGRAISGAVERVMGVRVPTVLYETSHYCLYSGRWTENYDDRRPEVFIDPDSAYAVFVVGLMPGESVKWKVWR